MTGASSGIGRELARCFAADGCRMILLARKRQALESLAEELRRAYKTHSDVLPADLVEPAAPARIFAHLESQGTRVDVLVNNAGFGARGKFAELPLERQLQMVQVNLTALTHLAGLFLPGMLARRRGGILNVASTAAFQPGPGMAIYYATKAYVLSFSEALGEELLGTGLTVSTLCPGPTETNFTAVAGGRSSKFFLRAAMSAQEVARIGHQGFRQGRFVVVPGFRNRLLAFGTRLGPRNMVRKIAKRFNAASYE